MPVEQPDQALSLEVEQFQFQLDNNYSDPSTNPLNPTPLAEFGGPGNKYDRNYHPNLTRQPCDSSGNPLPVGQPSLETPSEKQPNNWSPYSSCLEFKLTDFLFTHSQMSAANISELLDLWNAMLLSAGSQLVFKDSAEMYKMIDCTILSDVQWENYTGDMDCQLFQEYESAMKKRQWEDFKSGDWAWTQVVHQLSSMSLNIISHDSTMHGSTFIPIILGSDKMTMSVVTGRNDYYPLYLLIGNISNKVCCAHCNSVALRAFLAIPHSKKPAMTKPTVMQFGDGHYHCITFGLEQVLLACIVQGWCAKCLAMRQELNSDVLYQSHEHAEALIEEFDLKTLWDAYGIVGDIIPFTSHFPHANIYQLISPDILHQIIKEMFKDHLVKWVKSYLKTVHGTTKANAILDDIDQRIMAITPFTGLCHFPEGHHFKQWTSNDSKVLMKVYLPAIEGHVPTEILVHCNVLIEETLVAVQDTINHFHKYWEIFCQSGTIQTFSLPHQHAMKHYPDLIHLFRVLNGLCTSITESKHIDAVKDPHQQTNCNKLLGQMLIINQCLDNAVAHNINLLCSEMKQAKTMTDLAIELSLLHLPIILEEFLLQQANADNYHDLCDIPLSEHPVYGNKITVINSAVALFYVPSDISGIGGMQCEYICSCHSWKNGPPWYDCAFVNTNPGLKGMHGLDVVHILGKCYPCAVVQWFDCVTKIQIQGSITVIHIDTIYCVAHLVPLYGTHPIPRTIKLHHSYDIFTTVYMNRFIDHHAFLLLSDSYL
ncbi:hypothetical protein F5J12DRAFT_905037 [Pisolithus orientalis]|uniref:uncharacterized protein n=1 Tax=Pisolithus orientalis TaxID=936130 RepID=UPI0022242D95|nr:uncharacterized protein F5J12DRAFT_905037 [Pisolithus orientalis]KAI6009449.1 hypothetical protein F5J12DRAFT_905037 [Pisolithus orientalis]